MIRVLFICHGNICRSTMAQSIFYYMTEQAGLEDAFAVHSAATSCEEIGNPPHHGTARKLREEGVPLIPHRAVQMTQRDYTEYDYLIGMDRANIRNMERISGGDPQKKIFKMLYFSGEDRDVADPWYTGDFDAAFRDITEGCRGLLRYIRDKERL